MELLMDPHMWVALATLTVLELVLGIDNIIFISILVSKLPKAKQETARRIGLFMAMFMRIGLLLLLSVIIGLVEPLFTVMAQPSVAQMSSGESDHRPFSPLSHREVPVVTVTATRARHRRGRLVQREQRPVK